MADLTRRGFLTHASIATGVGIAGGLGLHQLLGSGLAAPPVLSMPASANAAGAQSVVHPALDGITLAGPMVVHVRDVASAEIAMMVGTQELIYRDPELVSRLVKTAAAASRAEG